MGHPFMIMRLKQSTSCKLVEFLTHISGCPFYQISSRTLTPLQFERNRSISRIPSPFTFIYDIYISFTLLLPPPANLTTYTYYYYNYVPIYVPIFVSLLSTSNTTTSRTLLLLRPTAAIRPLKPLSATHLAFIDRLAHCTGDK